MSKKAEKKVLVKGEWLTVEQVAAKYGKPLTPTSVQLLRVLAEGEEPVSLNRLTADLKVGKQTMYNVVKMLEKKGYIARIGKRNCLIGITEMGFKEARPKQSLR